VPELNSGVFLLARFLAGGGGQPYTPRVDNVLLYFLLVIALGIGFLLGRRERRRRPKVEGVVSRDYFRGLNHLLNERPDLAIDTFVEAMVVSDDTIDTHLALGSLVRRRGEVDKAIRIHQNLLARPVLSGGNRVQVELELARDYLMAGLLDRAETLLRELVGKSGSHRTEALKLLLRIYEREREWGRAMETGKRLIRHDRDMRRRIAHYYCELAEEAMAVSDLRSARSELARALQMDGRCARANLVGARLELQASRYKEVLRLLERVRDQDATLAGECLGLYEQASIALGDASALVRFASESLEKAPAIELVNTLRHHVELSGDPEAARSYIVEHLLHHPNLAGFVMLLQVLDKAGESLSPEYVRLVRRMSEALLEKQPRYRCQSCGFSGKNLMWQCPSCHEWGSMGALLPGALVEETKDGGWARAYGTWQA